MIIVHAAEQNHFHTSEALLAACTMLFEVVTSAFWKLRVLKVKATPEETGDALSLCQSQLQQQRYCSKKY